MDRVLGKYSDVVQYKTEPQEGRYPGKEDANISRIGEHWRVCVHRGCVEVSERIGQVIALALAIQAKREKPGVYQNDDPHLSYDDEYVLSRVAARSNCHKTVTFMLGLRPGDDHHFNDPATNIYLLVEGFDYRAGNDVAEVEAMIDEAGKFPLVGRVTPHDYESGFPHEKRDVSHSFIVLGKIPEGGYICFEKTGYGNNPFRVSEISEIFAEYPDRHWGFRSLEAVEIDVQILLDQQGGE